MQARRGHWPLIFLAYHGTQFGWRPTNFLATAGLIMFLSLVQASYQQTYRDALTGLPGRIAYEEATAQLGRKFSMAVLAIDQLKTYAGTHGKPVVEQILKLAATKVQAACQAGRVFRVSGEELTLLFSRQSAVETLVELEQHQEESGVDFSVSSRRSASLGQQSGRRYAGPE